MKEVLFEGYTDDRREQCLEDNCDDVVVGIFNKRLNENEITKLRKENADIDLRLDVIAMEERAMKQAIKDKREPLQVRKAGIINMLSTGGKLVEGKMYKFVDREAKMVGFYDCDGFLVEQRRMTDEDRQMTIRMNTGTND